MAIYLGWYLECKAKTIPWNRTVGERCSTDETHPFPIGSKFCPHCGSKIMAKVLTSTQQVFFESIHVSKSLYRTFVSAAISNDGTIEYLISNDEQKNGVWFDNDANIVIDIDAPRIPNTTFTPAKIKQLKTEVGYTSIKLKYGVVRYFPG